MAWKSIQTLHELSEGGWVGVIEDLGTDLIDGVKLIVLLEVLSQKRTGFWPNYAFMTKVINILWH